MLREENFTVAISLEKKIRIFQTDFSWVRQAGLTISAGGDGMVARTLQNITHFIFAENSNMNRKGDIRYMYGFIH